MTSQTTPIVRGRDEDRRAHRWAVGNQGYAGDFAAWCQMPISERREYEEGASHGDPCREIVEAA